MIKIHLDTDTGRIVKFNLADPTSDAVHESTGFNWNNIHLKHLTGHEFIASYQDSQSIHLGYLDYTISQFNYTSAIL